MNSAQEMEPILRNLLLKIEGSRLNYGQLRGLLGCIGSYHRKRKIPATPVTSSMTPVTFLVATWTLAMLLPQLGVAWQFAWRLLQNHAGDYAQCIIDMPVDSRSLFRPPVDCAICRDISQVDVVDHISPADFTALYAYSGRPLVVKDALSEWDAPGAFSYAFFQRLYAVDKIAGRWRAAQRCQFFPYRTGFRNLEQALSMSHNRTQQPWYFGWSNCDSEAGDVLRGFYSRPYFLPPLSESSPTDWIFMGTSGLGAHMHVDHVGLASWQAQIAGEKLWSLQPPPECFYQCQPMAIVVQPGDTIVLDTNIWYHKTTVVSEDVSITIGSEYD